MRIAVKTCNRVRILLERESVKSQRKIIQGEHSYYQVTLNNGKTLDLAEAIEGLPEEGQIDISSRSKFLERLNQKIVKE